MESLPTSSRHYAVLFSGEAASAMARGQTVSCTYSTVGMMGSINSHPSEFGTDGGLMRDPLTGDREIPRGKGGSEE